jgi:Ala-tRNA(Pro) deacylase
MEKVEQELYDVLNNLNIKYTRYEHEAVCTIEEANRLNIHIPGEQCKNLFLRNKKGDMHYLVILDEKKRADLNSIAEQINSTKLSFASEDRLYKYLGLKPGSVTPFGLINDALSSVVVVIDKSLIGGAIVNFHPNVNTATISVSYADLEKFIKWRGNKIYYVDIN